MDVKMLQILPVLLKVFIYSLPPLEFSLGQHVLDNPERGITLWFQLYLITAAWWLFMVTWTQERWTNHAQFVPNKLLIIWNNPGIFLYVNVSVAERWDPKRLLWRLALVCEGQYFSKVAQGWNAKEHEWPRLPDASLKRSSRPASVAQITKEVSAASVALIKRSSSTSSFNRNMSDYTKNFVEYEAALLQTRQDARADPRPPWLWRQSACEHQEKRRSGLINLFFL